MLYKAVAQTLLLYWRNRWVVTVVILKVLKCFHHRAARRILVIMDLHIEYIE